MKFIMNLDFFHQFLVTGMWVHAYYGGGGPSIMTEIRPFDNNVI